MSVKASFNRFSLDAETVLRAENSAAVTASGGSGTLSLDALSAYWNAGDLASKHEFAVIVHVDAVETGVGDETYEFAMQVDSVKEFSDSPVKLSAKDVDAAGRYVFLVSRDEVEAADVNAAHLRVLATLGGAAPSVTYHAYVAPLVGGQ